MEIVRVKNTKFRDALMNHTEGEAVYCEEENQCYVWTNGKYEPVESHIDGAGEIKINYRDLVISAISSFEPFNDEQIQHYQVLINGWEASQNKEFYMLYGQELNYFTLFHKIPSEDFCCLGKEIFECLSSVGSILYIEDFTIEDNAIIFWVKTLEGKLTELYLFDFTKGVVPFSC